MKKIIKNNLLLVFILSFILVLSVPAWGDSTNDTNNQTNTDYYGYRVHGYIASNTAVNYVKIFTETGGNLDAGTVTLYGYEK